MKKKKIDKIKKKKNPAITNPVAKYVAMFPKLFFSVLSFHYSESADLVREMIDQVAALHPGIKWFHVGADEVSDNFTFKKRMKNFYRVKYGQFIHSYRHHMTSVTLMIFHMIID